eukprot:Phypoly_transcript_14448.p2 GENE.Phypoly_transcript_14448~~Phypoly_transcript_14448.p2  ORF type:complete len:131 (-),score=15.57 Phypoly_transcript_14448:332-724(-)
MPNFTRAFFFFFLYLCILNFMQVPNSIIFANILCLLTGFSLFVSLFHVIMATLQIITIFGIANAPTHLTIAWMAFWPFGYVYQLIRIPPIPPPDPRLNSLREFLQKTETDSKKENVDVYGTFTMWHDVEF